MKLFKRKEKPAAGRNIPKITKVIGKLDSDPMISAYGCKRRMVFRCNVSDCIKVPLIMIEAEGIPYTIGLCKEHYELIMSGNAGMVRYVFNRYDAFKYYRDVKNGKMTMDDATLKNEKDFEKWKNEEG